MLDLAPRLLRDPGFRDRGSQEISRISKIAPVDFGQWFWLVEFRALTNFGGHRDGESVFRSETLGWFRLPERLAGLYPVF